MIDPKSGITLLELIVVIIIIGILAAFAIPNFYKAIETTKVREAISSLKQIKAGEVIYYNEEYTYWPRGSAESNVAIINRRLRLFLDTGELNWDYYVNATARTSFTATAKRQSGNYATQTITINQVGTWGGTWTGPKP